MAIKTERSDKKTNKAKIVKELIKDPLSSQRDIAKEAGVGLGTVNRVKKELEQTGTKDDRIVGICNKDISIVTLVQDEIESRIKTQKDSITMGDLIRAGAESAKRYSIFKGDITDSEGGLKGQDVIFQIINPNDK